MYEERIHLMGKEFFSFIIIFYYIFYFYDTFFSFLIL